MLSSCETVDNDSDIVDNYLSIGSGDSYELCYQKLQKLYIENQIISVFVHHPGYETITNYPEIVKLYSELQIIENNSDTINFEFDEDTLISISDFTNLNPLTAGPTFLDKWPKEIIEGLYIIRGDSKEKIHQTLNQLESDGILKDQFKQITYTVKSLNTEFDPNMQNSILWSILESKDYSFDIHFENGKVTSIHKKEVSIRALN